MKEVRFFLTKIKYFLLKKNKEVINDFYRKNGMLIGKGTRFASNILTPEPFLIEIGSNCVFANDVQLITHDNSASLFLKNKSDFFGKIKIGNNCFIGAKSIILYGVTVANNVIIAAGSVVTKSITEEGAIVAGNPAKKISTVEKMIENKQQYAVDVLGITGKERKQIIINSKMIIR